ncbi:EpsG family protein [Neobacillus drentensis]|uniref:EpsG family protein n=1 Tax=Neobacillus drentensis TaxID=220684 RepID=UPI002FFFC9C4
MLFGTISMYAISALKKDTVGIDTLGYKRVYESASQYSWGDFNYVYFEPGYILLMKIFSQIGLSFQLFSAIIYAFIYLSFYQFVKRYSKDVTLSLLIYICYIFFVFNISGIRNAISIAICLYSFRLLEKSGVKSFIGFTLVVLIAYFFHNSAIIFFLVYYIMKAKITPFAALGYIGGSLGLVIFRNYIYSFINTFIHGMGQPGEISIGGNIILLIGILIFSLISLYFINKTQVKNSKRLNYTQIGSNSTSPFDISMGCLKLLYVAIVVLLMTGQDDLSRSAMYLQVFIIILLPNILQLFEIKSRILLKGLLVSFLIIFFYVTVLSVRQYDIVPYYFIWQ